MTKNSEKDKRLISSVEFYFREGNSENFLKEAWLWAWALAKGKYGLDEDSCSEIVLKLVLDAEEVLHLFKERGYSNFPAFFTTYTKNLIWNQRRKEIRLNRSEILSDGFERFYDPRSEFTKEILSQNREASLLVRNILSEMDPITSLILKLKHRIPLNLKESRLFCSKLKEKKLKLRDYYGKDAEEERKSWLRKKELNEKLSRLYQNMQIHRFENLERWKISRRQLLEVCGSVTEEKSFKKIGWYLGLSEHSVRKAYYFAVSELKRKEDLKKIRFAEAA
ncbi:RNA polymerase subunit sigma-70 [Leptospira hartskeerlii]|uniref:RNA polymerase subunit sigma-70 n=1 Tax=Leptospira hartskeerlii TaxID=2023177 RepID=A0A2M9XD07_9LEPT|nr:RNA polymerase subunit sigma-70 [Leptospira hartskeerlii]PJZ25586.1 RNA polymerase subunit sigma-70 [Leptospira hartskeerlii]PJZ32137.1 RNA polymerase subunit sigma-70 [Leptospira hartskeerlii]